MEFQITTTLSNYLLRILPVGGVVKILFLSHRVSNIVLFILIAACVEAFGTIDLNGPARLPAVTLMHVNLKRLLANCSGATAVEYGLIAVIIVIGLIVLQSSIGSAVSGFFMSVANGL